MDEPGFNLKDAHVTIIGLGLMGGSMALSLKDRCRHLSALDIDRSVLELARRDQIVHAAGDDPHELLAEADLIILACPLPAILKWLERLPEFVQHSCILLDIGSSKRAILAAMDALPENFDPIGGHAICGKEKLSLANAELELYRDAPFALTTLPRTSQNAREAALQLLNALDAHPIWISADDHDRILASTSHLPYLLASALVMAAPQDAAELIGPGFRSSTRLAGTSSSMMLGVLHSNRDQVLTGLHEVQKQLSAFENALLNDDLINLACILDSARNRYETLIQ